MKAIIHICFIVRGLGADNLETTSHIIGEATLNFPALPRVGDVVYFSGDAYNSDVRSIEWTPVNGKCNVLEPFILLSDFTFEPHEGWKPISLAVKEALTQLANPRLCEIKFSFLEES